MYYVCKKAFFILMLSTCQVLLYGAMATTAAQKKVTAATVSKLLQPGVPLFDVTTKEGRKKFGDREVVSKELEVYGFKRVTFKATDGVELAGSMLVRPEAKRNIVVCAGFYEGLKEGMASFLHLFPQDSNILLFDARGHGESSGRFWSYSGDYGLQEYRDVIGALACITQAAPLDTFVFSYCMGSLHAAHALIVLSERNELAKYHVRGFICASGANSLRDLKDVFIKHIVDLELPKACGYRPTEAKKSSLMYWSKFIPGMLIGAWQTLLIMPRIEKNHNQVRLDNKIHKIQCPVVFMHAEKDTYIDSQGTQTCAHCLPASELVLLEGETDHFAHHLNDTWKKVYLQKIEAFIKKCSE